MHKTGFIFGKFYPLHKGHLELIQFASSVCEHLVVLVCCSTRELIPPETRIRWFSDLQCSSFIEIRSVLYDEDEYPNTSLPSKEVSRKWAELFSALVPDATLLVTSEPYGEYVAAFMSIAHMSSNPPRSPHLVSATALRNDLLGQWHWLAPGARRYFQKTVVIVGTESTGKTTLAHVLKKNLGGVLVEEMGREIVPDSNVYSDHQLMEIATRQARNIAVAQASGAPVVIVDTDVYITQSYAAFANGCYLDIPSWIYANNQADLRLYLTADIPYHQDGTRLDKDKRDLLDTCHRKTFTHFSQPFVELTGNYRNREEMALQNIRQLFMVSWRAQRQE